MPKIETIQISLCTKINDYTELLTPSKEQISEAMNNIGDLILPESVIIDFRGAINNYVALAILEFASKMKINYKDNDAGIFVYCDKEDADDEDI